MDQGKIKIDIWETQRRMGKTKEERKGLLKNPLAGQKTLTYSFLNGIFFTLTLEIFNHSKCRNV